MLTQLSKAVFCTKNSMNNLNYITQLSEVMIPCISFFYTMNCMNTMNQSPFMDTLNSCLQPWMVATINGGCSASISLQQAIKPQGFTIHGCPHRFAGLNSYYSCYSWYKKNPKVKFLIFSNSTFGSYDSLYIFFIPWIAWILWTRVPTWILWIHVFNHEWWQPSMVDAPHLYLSSRQ